MVFGFGDQKMTTALLRADGNSIRDLRTHNLIHPLGLEFIAG